VSLTNCVELVWNWITNLRAGKASGILAATEGCAVKRLVGRAAFALAAPGVAVLLSSAATLAQPGLDTGITAQVDPQVQQGAMVIQQYNCGQCHTVPGIPGANGQLAPNLGPHDDVPPIASRSPIATYPRGTVPNNSQDDLVAWILDPASLKPGTAQPDRGLSQDEAAAAAAYLYAIQPDGSVAGMGN
jgi:cytochrome c1